MSRTSDKFRLAEEKTTNKAFLHEFETLGSSEARHLQHYFFWAAQNGDESLIRLLLTNWTYLKQHEQTGQWYPIECKPVDVNGVNSQYWSALHLAVFRNHLGVVRILLDHGADKRDFPTSHYGHMNNTIFIGKGLTPFMGNQNFVHVPVSGYKHVYRGLGGDYVLKTDWAQFGRQDGTPIKYAIRYGYVDVVAALLESDVDYHRLDSDCRSLLHDAVLSGKQKVVEMLLNVRTKLAVGYQRHSLDPLIQLVERLNKPRPNELIILSLGASPSNMTSKGG